MILIWLGIMIVLILIDFLTKKLVMVFYAVSALVSMILSIFIGNFIIQFLIFIILGTIFFIKVRDNLIKLLKENKNMATKKVNKNRPKKVKNEK